MRKIFVCLLGLSSILFMTRAARKVMANRNCTIIPLAPTRLHCYLLTSSSNAWINLHIQIKF